jgi:hypothetical protein
MLVKPIRVHQPNQLIGRCSIYCPKEACVIAHDVLAQATEYVFACAAYFCSHCAGRKLSRAATPPAGLRNLFIPIVLGASSGLAPDSVRLREGIPVFQQTRRE